MTYSGFDPELLGHLTDGGASLGQVYLLQRIIRSIEPDTLLSQHSATLAGLSAEVPRAQAALQSHGERLQPRTSLLQSLCRDARVSVARFLAIFPGHQLLLDITAYLARVQPDIVAINNVAQRQVAAISLAAQLDILIRQLPQLLISILKTVWHLVPSGEDDWRELDLLSDELACLVASSDRDRSTLEQQLTYTVTRSGLDIDEIVQILLPVPAPFKVACTIKGAGTFSSLTILEPTAQQASVGHEGVIGWGPATNRLRQFLAKVPINREQCVISLDVEAVDKPSAGRLGRRRITELLDQYVAGHRLINLQLGDETLVTRVGAQNDTEELQPRHRGVARAYPLLNHWPEGLRECLRMSHVARVQDSPLTAAALAWVAVEACGVKHQQQRKLARVLSLQALRQQILEAHHNVLQSIVASTRYARTKAENAAALAEKYRRGLARCPAHAAAYSRLELLTEAYTEQSKEAAQNKNYIESLFREPLLTIREYAISDERNHLENLNTWLDILLPSRTGDSTELEAARAALDSILPHLSPLTTRQISDWQRRLTLTHECAEWLTTMQAKLESLLDALYGARNLTLHSGIFAATGDAVLGQGAIMLVDFTLEFLGNWYMNKPNASTPETPVQAIEQLADRQLELIERLKSHSGPAYALNVAWLSSPTSSDGWDRV